MCVSVRRAKAEGVFESLHKHQSDSQNAMYTPPAPAAEGTLLRNETRGSALEARDRGE